jgi:hypothetical protein
MRYPLAAFAGTVRRIVLRLFCHHAYLWVRTYYGDEINIHNGKRSLFECRKCGHLQDRDLIYPQNAGLDRQEEVK